MRDTRTDHRLDDIDRRILHALMGDARHTTAASLADSLSVSGATVRNRIAKLEDAGIVRGYHAQVDFERAGGKLTNLYICNVPIPEREALARKARSVAGVVNVRALMTGRGNLHVLAVGEDTADLQRISRTLSGYGIEIEDEDLVQDEFHSPYEPFGPEADRANAPTDFISLTGEADVLEVRVGADAPITGLSLATAMDRDVIDEHTLVIGIERDDRELTPHGDTVVSAGDVVTVLSRSASPEPDLDAFRDRPSTTTDG